MEADNGTERARDDTDEIMTAFRARRWEPEPASRPWLLAVFVVAVSAGIGYVSLRPTDPATTPAIAPASDESADPVADPVAPPAMPPDRSVPVTPRQSGEVAIYECKQNGQRVLSDRPCGPDAVERVIETGALNTFTEVPPPRVIVQPTSRTSSSAVAQGSVDSDRQAEMMKAQRCAQLQARIDYINAKTRERHSHREGDYWRAEWHKAKNAYYDARCGR